MSSTNGQSELYQAAKTGNLSAVKAQVQQLQDQDATTESLELSLKNGLEAAIRYKHPNIITYLLDHGAKLDPGLVSLAINEDTPVSVFGAFLNHGCDINEPIANGSPVLKQLYIVPNAAFVRWLLAHGADPNKRGYWNEQPITVACGYSTPEVVDFLLAHGASLYHSDALRIVAEDDEHRPQSLIMLSHLLDLGMDVNEMSHIEYPEERGLGFYTPLHAAIAADFADAVRLLMERGANWEIKNTLGKTLLEHAIEYRNEDVINAIMQNGP